MSRQNTIEFIKVDFGLETIDFNSSEFTCSKVDFKDCEIKKGIIFSDNIFGKGTKISFDSLIFDEGSRFVFRNPHLSENIIMFQNIIFIPFLTTFENIGNNINKSRLIKQNEQIEYALLFRNCALRDVYFINNQLSNFSFYKSAFENANFVTLDLNYYKRRKLIIFEDYFFYCNRKAQNFLQMKRLYHFEPEIGYTEIANIYRKFKVALDSSKDYQKSGLFYFNEFEMLRLGVKHENNQSLIFRIGSIFKNIFYFLYKLVAGYGEKPMWSIWTFFTLGTIFASLNMHNGFKTKYYTVNYMIDLSMEGLLNFLKLSWLWDFFKSSLLTLYRIFPSSYFPFGKEEFQIIGNFGNLWSPFLNLINSAFLILILTFILLGFKRYFRRY